LLERFVQHRKGNTSLHALSFMSSKSSVLSLCAIR